MQAFLKREAETPCGVRQLPCPAALISHDDSKVIILDCQIPGLRVLSWPLIPGGRGQRATLHPTKTLRHFEQIIP